MLRLGLIGFGYWGAILARVVAATPGASLAGIADVDPTRIAEASARHPQARVTTDAVELLDSDGLDAVVVATPAATHAALARAALARGHHVLVEKPLALDADEADALVSLALARGRVLMVDHTFVYSGAVRRLRALLDEGEVGDVLAVDATRTSLSRFHPDIGVAWDLAVHDLAILDYLLGPSTGGPLVQASAIEPRGRPDVVHVTLRFGAALAHVHASWLTMVKLRRMVVTGTLATVVYDGLDHAAPLTVYDAPLPPSGDAREATALRTGLRAGRAWVPEVATDEPLAVMLAHFVHCVTTGARPLTDARAAARVVRLLTGQAMPA
jgi:predicted dehydrogenase